MDKIKGFCLFCYRKSSTSFCSEECRERRSLMKNRFLNNRKGKLCPICGSELPDEKLKVCSRQCAIMNVSRVRALKGASKKPAYESKHCEICGVEFAPSSPIQEACSRKCSIELKNIRRVQKYAIFQKEKQQYAEKCQVQAVCPKCGKTHVIKLDVPFIGTGTPRLHCSDWPGCSSGEENNGLMSYIRQIAGYKLIEVATP